MASPRTPQTFLFKDDGSVPNNPTLPVLIYRRGIDLSGNAHPEKSIEQVFAANGWGHNMWRNGIYPYVHYHSMIHEALAIARGRAKLRLGGSQGEEFDVSAGDVLVLPAGTGHQCLWDGPDLSVVGAYPPRGTYNLCRGSKEEHGKALQTIPQVPLPDSDPVAGADGPLTKLWRP
ncbi:MAG: cupin domain-containing protein [Pseudolabrys sp.]